jgi:hypothetical protein
MRILPLTITLLFTTLPLIGQVDEMRSVFTEAESHYLFGEYELANPLYLILNDYLPGNANIKYKIGNCYINIPGEQKKAIPFLEEAVMNASYEAKPESFRETRAPLDALFSLATAYRINNQFKLALDTYSRLNEELSEKGEMINMDFIDQQIEACNTALMMIEEPVKFIKRDMGSYLNPGSINSHPAVSGDGSSLVFTEQRGLENVIFYSRKVQGVWKEPVDITRQLGDARDCSSSSLNYDGTVLYLYKNDQYDGNIYVSEFDGTGWSGIRKLNKNINTKYYESHASVSMDGKRLYFTSNREGGMGGLDIYVSELNQRGEWGVPENLGKTINTPFNENTPFITADDSLLFFSSEGHYNMGGYDLFKAAKQGNGWKTPENLGYPLSTSDDDLFYQPFNQGANGYYSMYTGYKEKRIQYITMGEDPGSYKFEIKGIITLSDTVIEFNKDFMVLLTLQDGGDTLDISFPNRTTGFYHFQVKPDAYHLIWKGKGYLSQSKSLEIKENQKATSEVIDILLEPDPDYTPEVVEKVDYSQMKIVDEIDSSVLVTDVFTRDVSETDETDSNVLYYTVQLHALYNPVDISFFKDLDVMVFYNKKDLFYRYVTGRFRTRDEAYRRRDELKRLGYPDDIFVQTVYVENQE